MGGFASARYALRNKDMVDFAIPFAPVISGELIWAARRRFNPEEFNKWQEDGVSVSESSSIPGKVKEKTWDVMVEYLNHSLLVEQNENPPMFLISCENDEATPPSHVEIFYKSLTGEKEYKMIRDAPHTPKEKEHLDELFEVIDVWLKKQLKNSD